MLFNILMCILCSVVAHLNLGQLLASRGRCEEAERVFRRCANLNTKGLKDPKLHEDTKMTALLHLGRLHVDRGKYRDAVDVFKEAVAAAPPYYQFQARSKLKFLLLSKCQKVNQGHEAL